MSITNQYILMGTAGGRGYGEEIKKVVKPADR